MRKRIYRGKRSGGDVSLAFLDIISCSFGAIVLLLLIVKVTAPEPTEQDRRGDAEYQAIVKELQAEAEEIQDKLASQERKIDKQKQEIANITNRFGEAQKAVADSGITAMAREKIKQQFKVALQDLNSEIEALEASQNPSRIGGIPADSKHIIFIVDTSGSMHNPGVWKKLLEQMDAILNAYPKVEGIQVMNDMGEHLFGGYRGRWLKDTATMRRRILTQMANWNPFSNSNPVEGIYQAVSLYASKASKISLYIFGDDFSGSIQSVINQVEKINRRGQSSKIRIHAIGFYTPGAPNAQGYHYFARLSALTRKNRGTFIGISTRE